MADAAYSVARIDGLEDDQGWSAIRQLLDVRAFGVNAWTARDAGQVVIVEHDERGSGHEEIYFVVAGNATFTVNDDDIDAPRGSIVFVRDPSAMRTAISREPHTTVLAVGGKHDDVYRPQPWEVHVRVAALFERSEYAAAKELLLTALDRFEENSGLLYNLACADAQLGETDAAIEHLRAAIKGHPSAAASAREDPDLTPIREDSRFDEVTSTIDAGDTRPRSE